MNDGSTKLKIPRDCKTSSIQPAVQRILDHWLLKTHFQLTRLSEKCYTAEILFGMYSDKNNLVFLLFLQPILIEVQRVNNFFESKNIERVKLLDDLILLIKSIGNRLILPTLKNDVINENIDDYLCPNHSLGYRFEAKIDETKQRNILTNNAEFTLNKRCRDFLLSLFI